MIHFVVCEDEKEIRKNTVDQIFRFMMNYDIDYKISEFDNYNEKFNKLAQEKDGFKVYFLDIKTDKGSGIDAARMIREKYEDWNSIIIILTSYSEYKYEVLSSRLYILDFINKLNNSTKKIQEDLEIAMKTYDDIDKSLKFEYNHTYYKIDYRQIVYIEKEPDSKRCIIKTKTGEQVMPGTLTEVYKKLDNRFFKTHKSLIINTKEIYKYERKLNKITFKNGDYTYLISRDKKKELLEYVGNTN